MPGSRRALQPSRSWIGIAINDQSATLPGIAQGFRVRTFVQLTNRYATVVVVKRPVLDRLGVSQDSPLEQRHAALKGLTLGTTGPASATDTTVAAEALRRLGA